MSGVGFFESIVSRNVSFTGSSVNVTIPGRFWIVQTFSLTDILKNVLLNLTGNFDIEIVNAHYISISLHKTNLFFESFEMDVSYKNMCTGTWLGGSSVRIEYPSGFTDEYGVHPHIRFPEGDYEVMLYIEPWRARDSKQTQIVLQGSHNVSLPLNSSHYAAVGVINLQVPTGPRFVVDVKLPQNSEIIVTDWQNVDYKSSADSGYLSLEYPKGQISHDQKSVTMMGGQQLRLPYFHGKFLATQTPIRTRYHLIVAGDAEKLTFLNPNGEVLSEVPSRSYLDILIIPSLGASLAWVVVVRHKYKNELLGITIPPVIIFCLGSLVWAIHTEKPLWLQQLLGYSTLFVTVIIAILEKRRGT